MFTLLPKKISVDKSLRVAIIIPYRDRAEHLEDITRVFKTLEPEGGVCHVYVVEQVSKEKFNRGLLLNVGFYIAHQSSFYDRYVFHDVDSYPDVDLYKQYFCFKGRNIHYASPYLGYKNGFHNFFGGVGSFTAFDFMRINGFPNSRFGWGGEDDMLLYRAITNNVDLYRPAVGSYTLPEHDGPSKEEATRIWENETKKNIKIDKQKWRSDGVMQVIDFQNIRYRETKKPMDMSRFEPVTKPLRSFVPSTKRNSHFYYFAVDWDITLKKPESGIWKMSLF